MAGASSPLLDRRTTKSRAVIFAALRSVGHAKVAEHLGISESAFSEFLKTYGDRIALLLTAIEHKPVPIVNICYPPEHIHSLEYFARRGMERPAEPVDWDAE